MTDRGRSSYSSWLVVEDEEAVDLVTGTYRCSVENEFGSSAMELLVSGAMLSHVLGLQKPLQNVATFLTTFTGRH